MENEKRFQEAAALVLEREQIDGGVVEIGVSFVSANEIKELNAAHRGKDAVTDVLSFPMYETADEVRSAALRARAGNAPPVALGDVVICHEIAESQAKEYGHSLDRELLYLFVHSAFHLLGYDHEGEDADARRREMRDAEEDVLARMGLARGE